ncbi:MAG: Gar1/Naf1 family protein [Thaumarchaeota archaeon]|nr:Gar1/Naf1 family protein [Nitrososphaerota archaeon]
MQEAGTVLHLAKSGRLIIKANSAIREGTVLVDEKGRSSGKVMEIIGPVSSPYLSAQPFTDRVERLVGTKLFVSDEAPQEYRKKRYSPHKSGPYQNDRARGSSRSGSRQDRRS